MSELKSFVYEVVVRAESQDQADRVMDASIAFDCTNGLDFEYTIEWGEGHELAWKD